MARSNSEAVSQDFDTAIIERTVID